MRLTARGAHFQIISVIVGLVVAFIGGTTSSALAKENAARVQADSVLNVTCQRASGLSEKLSLQTLRIEGQLNALGLAGSFVSIYQAPGRSLFEMRLDSLEWIQGLDGQRAWLRNHNRRLNELSGSQKSLVISDTYLLSFAFLHSGASGGEKSVIGSAEFSGRGGHWFRFVPFGGLPLKGFVDSLTGDLLVVEITVDDIELTTVYQDFRQVAGIRLPFRAITSASEPQFASELIVRDYQVNVPLESDWLAALGESASSELSFPAGLDSVTVPLEFRGGHLFVAAAVNDSEPLKFLLDTGAGSHMLDLLVAYRLKVPTSGSIPTRGVAGYETASLATLDSLTIGALSLPRPTVIVALLDNSFAGLLGDVAGVIGYDLFADHAVRIDYKNLTMTVYRPSWTPDLSEFDSAVSLPLRFHSNVPVVRAEVGGKEADFLVDLGSSFNLILHPWFATDLNLGTGAKTVDGTAPGPGGNSIRIGGVGGSLAGRRSQVSLLRLGSLSLAEVPVTIIEEGAGITASTEIAGVMGNEFLENYVVVFDYPRRIMTLTPVAP